MVMHSKTPLRSVACAALVLALAACETIQVDTDYYESFSFVGHDTFAWVSEHPMVAHSVDVSPFAEGRIEAAIIAAMQKNGIRYVENPADAKLLVGFSVSAKEKISVTPIAYPAPYWGMYPWVGNYYQTVDVRQYSQGRFTIDVFDTEDKLPVWHGSAMKNIDDHDELKGRGLAREAVGKVLAGFPSGTKN